MKLLPKLEAIAAVVSFVMIFVCGLLGQAAVATGMNPDTAGKLTRLAVLLFFFIFGFSCVGLMIHVFVVLQIRIGNAAAPLVRLLADHETGITFAFWGFLGLGTLIALPFMLKDLVGLQMPIGRSNGALVADIGMTMEEVKRRSTLKMNEPRLMGDGSHLGVETKMFDFRMRDSVVPFPQSRYYWMETGKGDTHIIALNIGITPRQMPKPDPEVFRHKLQGGTLRGWMG